MKNLFATHAGWANFFLRIALGVVIFPHGAQKVLGWFGGHGLAASYHQFVYGYHITPFLVVLVFIAEFAGSIGLVIGFLTRIAAFGIFCDMIGAIMMVHRFNGFFMNWSGKQHGEGIEYHLLVLGMCLALMIAGAGNLSLDKAIAGSQTKKEVSAD